MLPDLPPLFLYRGWAQGWGRTWESGGFKVRAREDGASRALEESLGWGSCPEVDDLRTVSFGSAVMSRMIGIQRAVGPRVWKARVLRLSGTDATAGARRDVKAEVRRDVKAEVRRTSTGDAGTSNDNNDQR
jgi:hypothetical protein